METAPNITYYHRRWDEEKYFDKYKNDMANAKAWGKSPIAIEQQALLALVTHLLMRFFLHQKVGAGIGGRPSNKAETP